MPTLPTSVMSDEESVADSLLLGTEEDDERTVEDVRRAKGYRQKQIEDHIQTQKKQMINAPIKADIYQLRAIGWQGTYVDCKSIRMGRVDDVLNVAGLFMIPIIQVIGPVAIMVWAIYSLDFSDVQIKSPFAYEYGSKEHGVSCVTTRLMSFFFLYLFTLYGIATLKSDDETLLKLRLLFNSMKEREPNADEVTPFRKKAVEADTEPFTLTVVGPLINSWVMTLCSLDMFLVFLLTDSPKDVLFDSLGLFFLFNLDDIPGQMSALFPDWPSQTVGDVYNECLVRDWREQTPRFKYEPHDSLDNLEYDGVRVANPDAIMGNIEQIEELYKKQGISMNWIYWLSRWVLRVLVVVLPIAYLLLCETVKAKKA